MKNLRFFMVTTLVIMLAVTCFAQSYQGYRPNSHSLVLRAGYTGFKDIGAGWTWNIGLVKQLDKQVMLGLETDLFYKGDTKQSLLGESHYQNGVYENTVEIEEKKHRLIVPLYGTIHINLGSFKNQPFEYIVGGGAGYQLLFSSHTNYLNEGQINRSLYGGWLWFFKGGVEYRISRTSRFILNLFYRRSLVSKESDNKGADFNLPTRDQVDLSGLGVKFGLAINL